MADGEVVGAADTPLVSPLVPEALGVADAIADAASPADESVDNASLAAPPEVSFEMSSFASGGVPASTS